MCSPARAVPWTRWGPPICGTSPPARLWWPTPTACAATPSTAANSPARCASLNTSILPGPTASSRAARSTRPGCRPAGSWLRNTRWTPTWSSASPIRVWMPPWAMPRPAASPTAIGFIKNKYIGRTFIQGNQKQRENSVRIKLNVIASTVRDKRVVLIDDSIVRGTTSARIIKLPAGRRRQGSPLPGLGASLQVSLLFWHRHPRPEIAGGHRPHHRADQ